jgi:uncharacterized RDD family membrane protein YckC
MSNPVWFYAKDGQQVGPATLEEIQALARAGSVRREDLIWTEGMSQWTPAGSVASIFPSGAVAPGVAAPPAMLNYLSVDPTRPNYAGFWTRFCGVFIDGLMLRFAGYIFQAVLTLALGGQIEEIFDRTRTPGAAVAAGLTSLATLVGGWLYESIMISSVHQATLGKMAVGIKVTDMRGQRLSFGRATGRHFAKFLSALTLLIGYILAAFTERKQALHDLICSTMVIKK